MDGSYFRLPEAKAGRQLSAKTGRQQIKPKMQRLQYEAVAEATSDFARERLLGCGSFANVFKGRIALRVLDRRKRRGNTEGDEVDAAILAELKEEDVAIKVIKEDGADTLLEVNQKALEEELRLMSRYRHRNLCCLLAYAHDGPRKAFVYQYCKQGDLFHQLHGKHSPGFQRLTWQHRLRLGAQLFRALEYLHCSSGNPVVHRDVKSLNVLIDAEGQAKLADFGTVREVMLGQQEQEQRNSETHAETVHVIGTREYMPPEVRSMP